MQEKILRPFALAALSIPTSDLKPQFVCVCVKALQHLSGLVYGCKMEVLSGTFPARDMGETKMLLLTLRLASGNNYPSAILGKC